MLHGRVAQLGERPVCTRLTGVRILSRPPYFRLAEGLRALASEAGCRWFESTRADHSTAGSAGDDALGFYPRARRFESGSAVQRRCDVVQRQDSRL